MQDELVVAKRNTSIILFCCLIFDVNRFCIALENSSYIFILLRIITLTIL